MTKKHNNDYNKNIINQIQRLDDLRILRILIAGRVMTALAQASGPSVLICQLHNPPVL